jgi:hypothetical protein
MGGDVYRDFQIQFSAAAGRYFVRTAAQEHKQIADVVTEECLAALLSLKPNWAYAEDVEVRAVTNGFHGKVGNLAPEFTLRVSTTALKLRQVTGDSEQIGDAAKFLHTQIARGLAEKLHGDIAVQSVVACIPTRN